MKKMILLLVSGLLIACMAGSAMATATVLLPDHITINPNNINIATVSASISLDPGTYQIKIIPSDGLSASISSSSPISVAEITAPNFATSSAFVLSSPTTYTGSLNVRGTKDGTVRVQVLDASGVIVTDVISAETLVVSVPEFPTVALPVAGLLGILFVFGRKKEGL